MTSANVADRWLISLDVDGTILHEDGTLSPKVAKQIARVAGLGHEIMIATGRSVGMTLPIIEQLKIEPRFVVCANGAITIRREPDGTYVRDTVETFDPTEVLTTIRSHLESARYAVEDEAGLFRYSGGEFPEGAIEASGELVEFEELMDVPATRVVVISPEHAIEDFLAVVEKMGLHRVSYNVGWTAWLDIAPAGVNKGVALEKVRARLEIPADHVMAVGDGRNDIEMLEWAAASGRGVAMGQAPDEVKMAANETTGSDVQEGVATLLRSFRS